MTEARVTNDQDCKIAIEQMSFAEKCCCRLNHETALHLKKQGCGLNSVKGYRGALLRVSIPQALKVSERWAKFFMKTSLSIWAELLDETAYQNWLVRTTCSPANCPRVDWPSWVYGGARNPMFDQKHEPIDWFEKLKREVREEVKEELRRRGGPGGLRPVNLAKIGIGRQ